MPSPADISYNGQPLLSLTPPKTKKAPVPYIVEAGGNNSINAAVVAAQLVEESDKDWESLRKIVEQKRIQQQSQQNAPNTIRESTDSDILLDDMDRSPKSKHRTRGTGGVFAAVGGFFKNIVNPGKKPATKEGKGSIKQRTMEQRAAKTFFANERTMLSWLNTATFLSLAGLTLINTHTTLGRVAGVALTLITVAFAAYALYKYLQRLYGLKTAKGATGLDDRVGPPALIVSFCVVLLVISIYFATTDTEASVAVTKV